MMKKKKHGWVRTQRTMLQNSDPTDATSWEIDLWKFSIEIDAIWDVDCTIRWKGYSIFFTSKYHHRFLNKIAEWKFNRLEDRFQEELLTWSHDNYDRYYV